MLSSLRLANVRLLEAAHGPGIDGDGAPPAFPEQDIERMPETTGTVAGHPQPSRPPEVVVETARQVTEAHEQMIQQMGRVIVGQKDAVDLLMLGLLCQGHCVLEGVPGLAKTLMISSLAKLLGLEFGRIQFTPDLMPSDITGTEILEEDHATGKRVMRFVKGPLFANVVLADEINRTPPKTQAALLQAMQEYQVTAAGQHYALEKPFFVLGTQNPIESEGTYPLPEAALDRFMFKIRLDYPSLDEEVEIALNTTSKRPEELAPVLSAEQIIGMQQVVREVIVARPIASYAVRLARATRPNEEDNPDFIKQYLSWGAGPRACQALLLGAKAKALLDGRPSVAIEDIRFVARPVLRHRIVPNFTAESENVSTDDIVEELLEQLPETA
ncbi:MAG: MoxR family ATPase [Phycisphaeraceae bacterium]